MIARALGWGRVKIRDLFSERERERERVTG